MGKAREERYHQNARSLRRQNKQKVDSSPNGRQRASSLMLHFQSEVDDHKDTFIKEDEIKYVLC